MCCVGNKALTHNHRVTKETQVFKAFEDPKDRREDKDTEEIEDPLDHRSERKRERERILLQVVFLM